MDDLSQQINQFLNDPQSMKMLQGMLGSLGLGGPPAAGAPPPPAHPAPPAPSTPPPAPSPAPASNMPDLSALSGMLGALGKDNSASTPAGTMGGADMIALVSRLGPLLSQVNQEDDSTRLLRALRPMLSEQRRQKIDEAVKILQLMRLLPLLRDMGALPGLL